VACGGRTLGHTYPFQYSYSLAGALLNETYPSGRGIDFDYDLAGRLFDITEGDQAIVWQITYATNGAFLSYNYGNDLTRQYSYNLKLQPQEITDSIPYSTACGGTTPYTGATTWYTDVQLLWGANATQNQSNNGNLQGQLINTCNNGTQANFSEGFQYDAVNRLAKFTDNGGGNNERDFNYDAYGNMWVTSNSSGFPSYGTTPSANVYNAANQRGDSGYAYDGAGNQTSINSVCPGSTCMKYDAENRQMSFGASGAMYQYDGNGKRVESSINGITTIYVYDAKGELAAEYSSASPTAQPPCQRCYLSWDHLGSVRLVTDDYGGVVSRHDYMPFGEEIASGFAGRSSLWGNLDQVSQRFTGKERDESGLDYFGARYYGSSLGRMTSPDPLPWLEWQHGNEEDDQNRFETYIANPQNLNMYAYVLNNPLSKTDPTGMNACGTNNDSSCKVTVTITDRSKDANGNYNDKYAGLKGNGSYNAVATVSVNGKVTGTFLGDTLSSGGKFATIANGTYDGVLHNHHGDPNKPSIELMTGGTNHIATIAPNPAQGGAMFATDVLIHPAGGTNSNPLGYTGLLPNGHGVSEACQLICSTQYGQFLGATGIRPADGSAPQRHFSVILNTSVNQ
jgi:RHS repeat-associated protein